MKKIFLYTALAAALVSCDNFLDMTPTDSVSAKTIWESTKNAEYSINFLWSYIWDYNASPTALGLTESLTDEMKYTSYNYNALAYIPSEMAYGGSTLTNNYVDVYMGQWGSLYTAIRRTNEGLSNLYSYGQMSDEDKVRLEAELRFLRGYFYFELVKRYKDVILYDRDLTTIKKDIAVTEEEKCWDFIQDDFKYAAANLPVAAKTAGRINKGMAFGMMSRAMLYAKRYELVKAAADSVAALGYDLEDNYADSYSKTLANGNREAILQYAFDLANGSSHSFNYYYTPGGDYSVVGMKGGAYGVPTQEIVESYEKATGGFPDWSKWHSSNGTTSEPPYSQLEPRFQATILYNGAPWKNRQIEPYAGGTDGWATWKTDKEPKGKTVTGYYLRKLVDESYDVNTSGSSQPFTFLRYGEVLLNKAEACYQIKDTEGANDAIRKIRGRVGLPYTDKSGTDLFDAIIQERKVELAFEGLRYWDLRRWGMADKTYPNGLTGYQQHGLKIEKLENGSFLYNYVSVDEKDREFPAKMYRFPMPESELSSNSLVNQYPEWK